MSKYFIQYHKSSKLGLPFTNCENVEDVFFENIYRNDLNFFTTKTNALKEIGSYCFLIVGNGKKGKMNFYLWSFKQIENTFWHESKLIIEGKGYNFPKPICINDWPGFDTLKKSCQNFRFGFTEINSFSICDTFIAKALEFRPNQDENYLENRLEINLARKLSQNERRKHLENSNKKPEKQFITTTIFKRNIFVIADVLERAKGICEKCKNKAPFIRDKDHTEYLEVHHIIPLSEDGDDTVENSLALCPNCHRHAHYGKKTYSNDC